MVRSMFFLLLIAVAQFAQGQCAANEKLVSVVINPDNYPNEISWDLRDSEDNVLAQGNSTGEDICVDASLCLKFIIYDEYGDGICCGEGQGSYEVYFDGDLVATGGEYTFSETKVFNCPQGYACSVAQPVSEGDYTAGHNDYWYELAVATTGVYTISTCDDNTCDTKIWLYDYCSDDFTAQDNTGTIYYDDNEGGCGNQAKVTAYLEAGNTYYIRIGSAGNDCSGSIPWSLRFGGEITGCIDPDACNYNPLANSDDGSCQYDDDPLCAAAPDLWVLESRLRSSLLADVINNNTDNCLIEEGCVNGFGRREIVRFTTHIKNIGDLDYYIGRPADNPDQFSFDNCHGHYHYEGYAEYRLANSAGELQPIGFKNGFCVLDLECSDGGNAQYGCGNMGISAQCGDYYSRGLQCQWVDVTDLPEDDYTLVVTVNWDRSPDALGNYESRYDNNWAQVCFSLERDQNGNHSVTLLSTCDVLTDCAGTPFGDAQLDCMGNCGGTELYGDLNGDGNQNTTDADQYIFDIINGGMTATTCNDLNQDGTISLHDAAMLNDCFLYGSDHQHGSGGTIHDHCNIPGGVVNQTHTVHLSIIDADFDNQTIDIGMMNPLDEVVGYEFNVSGIEIQEVTSLVNSDEYPATPEYQVGGTKVISFSRVDSVIPRMSQDYQPLCRIKYAQPTNGPICIERIVDIVNHEYHKVMTEMGTDCVERVQTGVQTVELFNHLNISPNPSDGLFRIEYVGAKADHIQIDVYDYLGKQLFSQPILTSNGSMELDLTQEAAGVYFLQFTSELGVYSRKVVKGR